MIAVVGPCASGKTTLVEALNQLGFPAKQVAQEHSYVQDMWQQLTKPDLLIYLDASYGVCTARKRLNWTEGEYATQQERLTHAREHCDLYIMSDSYSIEEILEMVLEEIEP